MPIVLCTYLAVRLALSWESMLTRFGDGQMKVSRLLSKYLQA